jgi:imidazolonepropionase-like amidohydrolase
LINGPRIIPSGALFQLGNLTQEAARGEIRKMAGMGIKFTGEIVLTPIPGPTAKEMENLRAVLDEGKKVGVTVQVHAVSSGAMVAAAEAGVPLLVHLPNKDWTSKEDAKRVAAAGTKVLGTASFGTPVFGVFADDNKPRFRDGKPWPEGIIDGVRLGEEAGYMPVNARTVWDAGVVLGYCTDTNYDPKAGLDHELKLLNVMFSMWDIIKMMGPNTASYIQMGDQLGKLEPGTLADIVLLDGDPLEGYWNWLKTKVVVKGGVVVVEKR